MTYRPYVSTEEKALAFCVQDHPKTSLYA